MLALVIDAAWRTAVFLGLCAVLMVPLEWGRGGARGRARGTIALLFANTVIAALVLRWAPFDAGAAPDWPRFALSIALAEVAGYGVHRAMHASPLLWRFHRVHHEPTDIGWLDAWRMHPVDALLHLIAAALPALLLGVPLLAHAPVALARKVYTSILHARAPWAPSRLDRWIATPAFHHAHHERAGNYAGLFAWLDTVFRTRVTG